MMKLTKRVIDGLQSDGSTHGTLFWDSELKGFGVRVFPTGLKTFAVKFRTRSGRQRWLKIGPFGPLTAEKAREKAKLELARVVDGEDPADERDQIRAAVTVAQRCDLYIQAAEAGLVLGRKLAFEPNTSTPGSRWPVSQVSGRSPTRPHPFRS